MVQGMKSGYTKEEALKRIYEVKKMSAGGCIFVPKSLVGLKIKLMEVKK